MARLSYPILDSFTGDAGVAVEKLRQRFAGQERLPNIYAVMANCPEGAQKVSDIAVYLRGSGNLDPIAWETAILVVLAYTKCKYEWSAHVRTALRGGLDADTIGLLADGRVEAIEDERLRAVACYALELARDATTSDATFEALRQHFDDPRALFDITLTVAFYSLIARMTNGLAIEMDDPTTALPFGRPSAELSS
jgi:alkylhydroperoxidase family enzyme